MDPAIDTRLGLTDGTELVLSLDAASELSLPDLPSHPLPKLLVRSPQPATDASASAKTKPDSTTRDKARPPPFQSRKFTYCKGSSIERPLMC